MIDQSQPNRSKEMRDCAAEGRQATAFANRDFHELPDGEVRLLHPHPRHFPSLAALVGVELPKEFAAALSGSEG